MTSFIIAASLLLIFVLVLLVMPMFYSRSAQDTDLSAETLAILREQKAELEAEHAAGTLSQESYAQALEELEQRVISEAAAHSGTSTGKGSNKQTKLWALGLVIFLPVSAGLLYYQLGTPAALDPANLVAAHPEQPTAEQIDQMVEKLAQRVKNEPNNIEAAQNLARAYMALGRYPQAIETYEALLAKLPEDANIFADMADAHASLQSSFEGKPTELIKKALKLDPNNVKALALDGTIAYEKADYATAIAQWERARANTPEGSELRQNIDAILQEARNRASPQSTSVPITTAPFPLRGRVTLAPALKSQVAPTDVIYIFVRAGEKGMPLASMRYTAADLPIEFDFSRTPPMVDQSSIPNKVVVGARISKSGDASAHTGDLQGFSALVSSADENVRVTIDKVVP